jgi:hypothetical protein
MKTIRVQTHILFLICLITICGAIAKDGKEVKPNGTRHHTRAISRTTQVRYDHTIIFRFMLSKPFSDNQ